MRRAQFVPLPRCIGAAFESVRPSVRRSVCPFWQTELRVTKGSICRGCEEYAVGSTHRARTGGKGREGRKGTRAKLAVLRGGTGGGGRIGKLDCFDKLRTRAGARAWQHWHREGEKAVLRLMLPHRTEINAQYFTHAACPKCLTRFGPAWLFRYGVPPKRATKNRVSRAESLIRGAPRTLTGRVTDSLYEYSLLCPCCVSPVCRDRFRYQWAQKSEGA